jgi:hypothetical protein
MHTHLPAGPTPLPLALRALVTLLLAATAKAQTTDDTQLWAATTVFGRFGGQEAPEPSPWRYWLEGQLRFGEDISSLTTGVFRPGVGYDLRPNATLWAGYALVGFDSPRQPESITENRFWQQFSWNAPQPLASLSFSSRTRLEQRLLEDSSETGWRLRQFFRVARPLEEKQRWLLIAFDEIFYQFNDTDYGATAGFDQNRAFLGIGYQFDPVKRVEFGYLNQYIWREGRPDFMAHVLLVGLFLTL